MVYHCKDLEVALVIVNRDSEGSGLAAEHFVLEEHSSKL